MVAGDCMARMYGGVQTVVCVARLVVCVVSRGGVGGGGDGKPFFVS